VGAMATMARRARGSRGNEGDCEPISIAKDIERREENGEDDSKL
jgi:hypothetical protein